jgi:predicted N-acetyltransferase YhbS
MSSHQFGYRGETDTDDAEIDAIHEEAFGPGRFARAAFRLREGGGHDPSLSLVALVGDRIVASVRQTPILVGERPALLLGPLAVRPQFKGLGAGRTLVRMALDVAKRAGHTAVILVGDEPYYGPLGFARLPRYAVRLPGPVDPDRILGAAMESGALDGLAGTARRAAASRPGGDSLAAFAEPGEAGKEQKNQQRQRSRRADLAAEEGDADDAL